jgi:hypothetical protein
MASRTGFAFFDANTHINPAAGVLERYVDPGVRPRLSELAQYRLPLSREADGSTGFHNYRVNTKYYRRIRGEAAAGDALQAQIALVPGVELT